MASVTLEHLTKTYPNGFVSVNDVSLSIEDGEFVVFHGPSGCGKSTILRMIGGLEDITSGKIYLGRDLLNDILPRDRHLAMAFQNYTLYRHFNVYDNIALGLRLRNLPRTVIDSRVKEAAKFFGITDVLDKKIKLLSSSDKQRVALARAVVFHPKVLLVDEDFSHQDPDLRMEMLGDILEINEELGITVLYVTNKQEEAAGLKKKTVFMKDGKITDIRSPLMSVSFSALFPALAEASAAGFSHRFGAVPFNLNVSLAAASVRIVYASCDRTIQNCHSALLLSLLLFRRL